MAQEEQIPVAERKVIEQAGMFQGLDLAVYFSRAKVGRLTVRNSNTKCSKIMRMGIFWPILGR